jgi:hypothetical protein
MSNAQVTATFSRAFVPRPDWSRSGSESIHRRSGVPALCHRRAHPCGGEYSIPNSATQATLEPHPDGEVQHAPDQRRHTPVTM